MNAIVGFMRSISFNNNNNPRENLQDLLRLLTLFFQFPVDVYPKFMDGLSSINIEIWLQVIPQIIARIHSKVKEIHDFCCHLLTLIGKTHPQALVFPLCVASTSILVARAQAAQNVMAGMRDHSATLLDQTSLVAKELVRSSILWSELWHEALGEATKLYYWEKNFTGLYNRLQVAHEQTKCPETINETSFDQTHGRDLEEAWSWLKKFIKSNKMQHLTKAWDLYYPVFHKLDKQLPTITRLELEHLSPQLFKARNLDVAVPGTYKPNLPVVNISHFDPVLKIIPSKQRPRRMLLFGSDGLDWTFLLKGHEDLRQDERVMQLFGLVNMLLKKDGRTHKFDLDISRYRVIPLSPNSGLISWVAHSDTLHQLIRDYRSSKNIELDKEYQEMLSQSQHYEKLPVMNKVEIFTSAMSNAVSDDLARVLWLRSPNSEVWMLQRLNYTCSLAVMSMVGYILGLGDRHPSNLMLDRYTGKVIHIDFGDCFEVAMKRDKYPEKIPFRLTRMLVNAMEVSGIEGTFRITCENVMTVLRENRESLMAVLEAFVHDPLLNWRLLTKQSPKTMDPIDPNITLHFESQSTIASFSSRPVLNSLPVVYSDIADHDVVNSRAIEVLKRIKQKLVGRDFHATSVLEVSQQVDYLLKEASDPINLCQSYFGWCPFW
uniref:non-specific serine/threonine protein kinase n=1 Tax=Arcella intermedia TaxID=1963864 RepID=A0A6B2KZH9_9EUKA